MTKARSQNDQLHDPHPDQSAGASDVSKSICPSDCPLRGKYKPEEDPPLPERPESLPLTRKGASKSIYEPLHDWQTRLLILKPRPFGSQLEGRLVTVDIVIRNGLVFHESQQRLEFEALSYTWGETQFPRAIKINDIALPIIENLYAFLQRYSSSRSSCALWIDSICINQHDNAEKSMQISNMLAIYEKATRVIVWLGEHGKHTRLAIEYLIWLRGQESAVWNRKDYVDVHSKQCNDRSIETIDGLTDLCSREWPSRLWVKQEVWSAHDIIVMCGATVFDWQLFQYSKHVQLASETRSALSVKARLSQSRLHILNGLRQRKDPHQGGFCDGRVGDIGKEHTWPARANPHEILTFLNQSVASNTSIAADRIYALLEMSGIQSQATTNGTTHDISKFPVDYGRSTEEIFRDLAKFLICKLGLQAVLNLEGTFGKAGGLDLPSWTPDWRFTQRPVCHASPSFYPSADEMVPTLSALNYPAELRADYDSSILRLRGYCIAALTSDGMTQTFLAGSGQANPSTTRVYPLDPCYGVTCRNKKLMSCTPSAVIQQTLYGAYDSISFQSIQRYFTFHNGLAVSTLATTGDIVAIVETAVVPVILRRSQNSGNRFRYVGCAWFLEPHHALTIDGGEKDALLQAQYELSGKWCHPWPKEIMEVE